MNSEILICFLLTAMEQLLFGLRCLLQNGYIVIFLTGIVAALMIICISAGIVPLIAMVLVCLMMRRYTLNKDLSTLRGETMK